ncbi:SRA stem-loop-interacting RNA-binding protein, mitochondrial [Eurosta solidaginis]|uniref:SRA stem-loop-interacting RNA-binding protein, mitochondrial n=1 Tax=Eurosta solidaginis TaxID=178769 RepID=UPI003530B2EC
MSGTARQSYKLFIANLPWTIGQKELLSYFSSFGHVANASVVFDKSIGFSKGYGFVTFSGRDGFMGASNKNRHFIEGRVLNVQPANS